MVMEMSRDDHARIAAAIHAAEARTSGQIICVLARASSDYSAWPILWAALIALSSPWPLIAFTHLPVQYIFIAQIFVFMIAMSLLSIGNIRVALAPRAMQRANAHRAALEQYFLRGVTRTRARTGVMIFVSLAERYARIVADDSIDAKVTHADWQAAVDALIAHVKDDRLADGFVKAIDLCGDILALHFPPEPQAVNELPDRLFII
jgi:putative membrane protein